MTAYASLLLDLVNWDLCVDASGNIATCQEPYRLAQDAACQTRLWSGELRYDTTQGVNYSGLILGHWSPPALIKANIAFEAMRATGVGNAQVYFTGWSNATRKLTGVITVVPEETTPTGVIPPIPFSVSPAVQAY